MITRVIKHGYFWQLSNSRVSASDENLRHLKAETFRAAGNDDVHS